MTTELLMTVGLIFKDSGKTKRIVGGAESHYSINDLSWLNFNGEKVMIRTSTSDLYFQVRKIDVFSSISGAINIGLTLDTDTQFDAVHIGDKVFKILNPDSNMAEEMSM